MSNTNPSAGQPDLNPEGLPPAESVTETGEFKFNAPGPIIMAAKAAAEEQQEADDLAAEVGMGPGTYKTRMEMEPHPWIGDLRAIKLGDKLPPLNMPHELLHFIMQQLDGLGWRKHEELSLFVYQDPEGDQHTENPGEWILKTDLPPVEVARKMAAAAPEEPLDYSDLSDAELAARENAIRAARIRNLKAQHMDIHAQVAEGFAVMPEDTRPDIRRTPPAPKPMPNPDGSARMPEGFAGNVGPQ